MNKLEIIEVSALAVVVLYLLIKYVVKAIKNRWIEELTVTINAAIKDAETSGLKGVAKKELVLERVSNACESLGIPFRLVSRLVAKLIEEIIKHYNIIAK